MIPRAGWWRRWAARREEKMPAQGGGDGWLLLV